MVDRWCVIINDVWLVINLFIVFWINIFVFVLMDEVVLLKINSGVFKIIVWVIVNNCFCFVDRLILFVKIVLYFFGRVLMKKWILIVL